MIQSDYQVNFILEKREQTLPGTVALHSQRDDSFFSLVEQWMGMKEKRGGAGSIGSQHSIADTDSFFGDDDDEAFVQALADAGQQFSPVKTKDENVMEEDGREEVMSDSAEKNFELDAEEETQQEVTPPPPEKQAYMATDAYKPNAFGDFASYMKNKRLKLKVQEVSISEDEARAIAGSSDAAADIPSLPPLFRGTNIYINGHTNPPYGEMRRLLHLYGGSLMPYLDQKTPVTHIIASNLTAKKRIEFKDYKVVRPEWVMQSIEQGKRLDWRDFRCAEDGSGAMKMGALGTRASVAKQSGNVDGEVGSLTEGRRMAANADWRRAAAEVSEDVPFMNVANANTTGSIGPWGKGSRQKALAGWAQKDSEARDSTKNVQAADKIAQPSPTSDDGLREEIQEKIKEDREYTPPQRSQSEEAWLANLETPPKPILANEEINPKKEKTGSLPDTRSPKDLNNKVFPSLGTDPPSAAAAQAAGLYDPSHPYASRPSNIAAAQLLSSPSWRQRNTATSDDFLAGFFGKSRLHHLSTWKAEMKEMVSQALREAGKEGGSVDLPKDVKRVIMHIDFDAFFVSVGLRNRPDLHDKAVVVCHGTSTQEASNNGSVHSTSEIASCNYIARRFDIRNGMSLGQANRLCKDVQTIPYDFEGYDEVAIKFYTILLLHADAIEAVSIDEALIDVSLLLEEMRRDDAISSKNDIPERRRLMNSYKHLMSSQGQTWTEEKQLAEALRDEIRNVTGCEVSIGIGDNILLARTATRKAKPGGSFHLTIQAFPRFAFDLDIDELHGIGWAIRNRCRDVFGTCKIGELTSTVKGIKGKLIAEFGEKQGVTIWEKLNGIERDRLESVKPRQSCGASVNYAIRFESDQEAKDFVEKLCVEVSTRLQAINLVGRVCSISIMARSKDAPIEAPKFLGHGVCDTFNRSAPFTRPTDDKETIFIAAWKLLCALKIKPDQLRGIGVSCQKLLPKEGNNTRPAGQSMLNFTTPVKDRHQREKKEAETIQLASTRKKASDEKADMQIDDEDENKELQAGPSGTEKRKRSVTPEETIDEERQFKKDIISQSVLNTPFPSTQIDIPPASQIDPDVLAALPEKIRNQIEKSRSNLNVESTTKGANRATSAEPQLDFTQRTISTMSTPEKHRTPINPFLNMRASSTTPTKRLTRQEQSRGGIKKHTYEMPRFSHIDPSVLAELPADVREEILRATGALTSTSKSKLSPIKGESMMRQTSIDNHTPKKKQRLLDLGLHTTKSFGGEPSTPPNNRMIRPTILNDTEVAIAVANNNNNNNTTRQSIKSIDPSTISKEELIRLGIDVDFFRALPEEVQRETYESQMMTLNDKQARFKLGKTIQEMSILEERRMATLTAFPIEQHNNRFHARCGPLESEMQTKDEPNLKGKRTLNEIRNLLTNWFDQFKSLGPRSKDIDRFNRFLLACIERGGFDQLEKVRGILKWWASLLQHSLSKEREKEKGKMTHAGWQVALDKVTTEVNEIVKMKYGALLNVR